MLGLGSFMQPFFFFFFPNFYSPHIQCISESSRKRRVWKWEIWKAEVSEESCWKLQSYSWCLLEGNLLFLWPFLLKLTVLALIVCHSCQSGKVALLPFFFGFYWQRGWNCMLNLFFCSCVPLVVLFSFHWLDAGCRCLPTHWRCGETVARDSPRLCHRLSEGEAPLPLVVEIGLYSLKDCHSHIIDKYARWIMNTKTHWCLIYLFHSYLS